MIVQASKRGLAFGKGKDWLGVMRHGGTKESTAGWVSSCSTRRALSTSSAMLQTHTTAATKFPVPPLALSAPDPPENMIPDLDHLQELVRKVQGLHQLTGGVLKDLEDFVEEVRVAEESATATEAGVVIKEDYSQYLLTLETTGLVDEDLRKMFTCCHSYWAEHMEYEPWKRLLHKLFPAHYGFRVAEEELRVATFFLARENKMVKVDRPFIVVHKRTADGNWPIVLLAKGYGWQYEKQLEKLFPGVVGALAKMAGRLRAEGQIGQSLALLAFFAQDFCWHIHHEGADPLRQGPSCDVREIASAKTLFQIAHFVRSL